MGEDLAGVEEIPACATGEQGGQLAGGQLVVVEQGDSIGAVVEERVGVAFDWRPQRGPQHEIDVHFEDGWSAQRRSIGQSPLPSGMVSGGSFYGEAEPTDDLLQRGFDLRPLGRHSGAVRSADVVHIDVDGEAREVEDEEVERRPSLERHPGSEERMCGHELEELDEHPHLFQAVRGESGVCREPLQLVSAEHQATSPQVWATTRFGTMSRQRLTSSPGSRVGSK